MAIVAFTPQLRRFLSVPDVDTPATTLRAALDAAFAPNPRLRGYVLDDQGERVEPTVMPREAFDVLPQAEPEAADAGY